MQAEFEHEVDRNFDVFLTSLESLMTSHSGQFVLLKSGQIEDFFPMQDAALKAGRTRYPDRIFSILEGTDRPVDLGFFSHAIDTQIA